MRIEINQPDKMDISFRRIGNDQNPLIVIDDFLANPEQVRDEALNIQYSTSNEYPGYVAPNACLGLRDVVYWVYNHMLNEVYPDLAMLRSAGEPTGRSRFSLFSPSPEKRVSSVHTDVANFIGSVLYLSEHEGSGTAFWRDGVSGLESYLAGSIVMLQKIEAMFGINMLGRMKDAFVNTPILSHREVEKMMFKRLPENFVFPKESHAGWEYVDHVPTKFNRLVFYHGWTIHSIYHENYQAPKSIEEARMTMNVQIAWPFVSGAESITAPIPGMETLRTYTV